jgi:molybdenum cofactor cytidylyltransferase
MEPPKLRGVACVVLAAGAASRFGRPKQALFLDRILGRIRSAGITEIVVVTGAHRLATEARTVHCAEWEHGSGASLRCGLSALSPKVEGALVLLADGPNVSQAAIRRVAARARQHPGRIVAASYAAGVRSHPVFVPRALWPAIPDEGARALPAALVDCSDLEPPGDVDLPEDVRGSAGSPFGDSGREDPSRI